MIGLPTKREILQVTCLSIYSGPDVDFGNGPYVWVDNLDSAEGTLEYFRCEEIDSWTQH